ncbi:hypothetical protein TSAR_008011, partial [Trichomalopsis sarcophagae]
AALARARTRGLLQLSFKSKVTPAERQSGSAIVVAVPSSRGKFCCTDDMCRGLIELASQLLMLRLKVQL